MPRTKSEEKRQKILAAAEAAFGNREFDEVLTDEIATGAGVGKGTLYRHFSTKEVLYGATLLRVFDELDAGLKSPRPTDERSEERLAGICREMVGTLWTRHSLFDAVHGLGRSSGTLRRELRVRRNRLHRMLERTLKAGIASGELRGHDPFVAAQLFLGMVRSAVVFRRPNDTIDVLAGEILAVFLRGVGTKETP
jgi:AcrR family transcriptional regulator